LVHHYFIGQQLQAINFIFNHFNLYILLKATNLLLFTHLLLAILLAILSIFIFYFYFIFYSHYFFSLILLLASFVSSLKLPFLRFSTFRNDFEILNLVFLLIFYDFTNRIALILKYHSFKIMTYQFTNLLKFIIHLWYLKLLFYFISINT